MHSIDTAGHFLDDDVVHSTDLEVGVVYFQSISLRAHQLNDRVIAVFVKTYDTL